MHMERRERIARVFNHVRSKLFPRRPDHLYYLFLRQRCYFAKWIQPGRKTHFRFVDIPHTCQHALMQQHVAKLFIAACNESLQRCFSIEV